MAYVLIKFANAPRPDLWVLERSMDFGHTYQPWQFFACESPRARGWLGEAAVPWGGLSLPCSLTPGFCLGQDCWVCVPKGRWGKWFPSLTWNPQSPCSLLAPSGSL